MERPDREPQVLLSAVDEETSYRPLAPLSLAALALGLAAPLAWAAPFLLIVPAAAVAAALIALSQINRSGDRLSGRRAALVGFALAIAFAASAAVRGPIRARIMQGQIDQAAQHWVELVAAGEFDKASMLMTASAISSFSPQRDPGAPPLGEDEIRENYFLKIAQDDVVQTLQAIEPRPAVRRQGPVGEPAFEGPSTRLRSHYLVASAETRDSKSPSATLELQFLRLAAYEADGAPWRVERWTLVAADGQ